MSLNTMSRTGAICLLSLCTTVADAAVDDGGHAACSAQFIDMLTTRGVPASIITDKGAVRSQTPYARDSGAGLHRWIMKAEQGGELVAEASCLVSVRSGEVRRLTLQPGPAMPDALTTAAR